MDQQSPNPYQTRWLLAFESSTPFGGVALLEDGEIKDAIDLEEGLRHGRDLMPVAAGLLARRGFGPEHIWATAVSAGPGSYTGIRVGVMSAKAFAYGAGCKLAGVSSLAALAESLVLAQSLPAGLMVMPIQDARRDEVYAGLYEVCPDLTVKPLIADLAVAPEEAAEMLANYQAKGRICLPVGSALITYESLFDKLVDSPVVQVRPRAGAVGRLAWRQLLQENYADPLDFQPLYLRRDPDADWTRDKLIS